MKTASHAEQMPENISYEKSFAVDTTFVLFFLAVEFGRTFTKISFDNFFLFATLLTIAILPYFLAAGEVKPNFSNWLFGRSLIAGFAVLLGAIFNQTLGVVLPETFRFLPLTLLIVAAMLSCYIQFYGFLKLRTAK